jgi:hypothetical protein
MVGKNEAQAQPYYGGGGMDNRYDDRKSYGMDDSYGSSNYGNDNSYGYEQPQYQQPSYKPDYSEPQYPSYGTDNKRDKIQKNIKNIDINKIKCINNNININGNNTGDVNIGNKGGVAGEGYSGAYSSGSGSNGYGGGYDGYDNKKDKGFDCIINNNNTNTNIGGGGNQTIPPDDGDEKATLNVFKKVECEEVTIQQAVVEPTTCAQLEAIATPESFNIQVTDTDPDPSSFPGSETGTEVEIGAGTYTVTETPSAAVAALLDAPNSNITLITTFTDDCAPNGQGIPIAAGETQDCTITNKFIIQKEDQPSTLTVIKKVECEDDDDDVNGAASIQQLTPVPRIEDCDDLERIVDSGNFTITVTGNLPAPGFISFPGEDDPGTTIDPIGLGPYTITEDPDQGTDAIIALPNVDLSVEFTGGCEQDGDTDSATGEILAGETETCTKINKFTIKETCTTCFAQLTAEDQTIINTLLANSGDLPITGSVPLVTIPRDVNDIAGLCAFLDTNNIVINIPKATAIQLFVQLIGAGSDARAEALVNCLIEAGIINDTTAGATVPFDVLGGETGDSSITSQGIGDSSEALAKITKLKQQWLDLLP